MNKPMKQGIVAAAMALSVCGIAVADDHNKGCSLETLHGWYIFSAQGYNIPATGSAQPKALIEFLYFDGEGTITAGNATRSLNGVVAEVPPGGTAPYTVAATCTGTITFNAGLHQDIFIPPDGESYSAIQTDVNTVLVGTATKVSH